jgi:hypothetical protein
MQYSPKLKKAMQEIQAVMGKYDIGGSIILHTPGYGEHYLKLDASYSAAKMIHRQLGGLELRFHIDSSKVGKDKAKELATDTTNLFEVMNTLIENHYQISGMEVKRSMIITMRSMAEAATAPMNLNSINTP